MFVSKAKKYAFAGLGLTLTFLLLILAGCDATSEPKVHYQATGSWAGTIKITINNTLYDDQVRGIIAPDGSYHLTIVVAGNMVGEYVGRINSIDPENIGSMTLQRLQSSAAAGDPQQVSFKLNANRLYSFEGIELSRTPDANGPAMPSVDEEHWSLSATDNTTEVVVHSDGTLSGGDRQNCQYSGTLHLIDPAWDIYRLKLTTANYPGKNCSLGALSYSGLAMKLNEGEPRPHLWFAVNSGERTFLGELSETINEAPVAAMTILGERADQSVLVQAGAAVELGAQGSTDANSDALTYAWSGTAPDGVTPLTIVGGSTATFIPAEEGLYTLILTVSDGIATDTLTRQITVVWTPDRYLGCGNGTVLDTRTNLLWLQDAGCLDLNHDVVDNLWGFSAATAQERVNTLLADAVCGLSDGSAPGNWRLPTVSEFRQIVTEVPFAGPPALLNGAGTGQWTEGDVFDRVGATHIPASSLYIYWTADPDPDPAINNWLFVDFAYVNPAEWSGSLFSGTRNPAWPVRALRAGEQCPPVP